MSEDFSIGCPKCSSTQITANKKGFSGGKAVTGALLTGGVGLLAGLHGKDKVVITCLACGHNFKPGEGKKIKTEEVNRNPTPKKQNVEPFVSSLETGEVNRIMCSNCSTENFLSHKYCKNCGKGLHESDNKIHSKSEIKLAACPHCRSLSPKDAKFCPHCSKPVSLNKNSGCAGVLACIVFLMIVFFLLK